MRSYNRYTLYQKLKSGKLSKNVEEYLKKQGLLKDYESFEELQNALLETLKKHKHTRSKLEKLRKYIKENPLEAPFSSTSQALNFLAKKFSLNRGDVVAFLRANAFKHIPATTRYIRSKRYENPIATYMYTDRPRRKRAKLKERFSTDDVLSAILDGEVAVYSSDHKKYLYTLKIGSLGLKHEGPYAIEEPPKEVATRFEREGVQTEGSYKRRLVVPIKDNDIIVLVK